MANSQSITKTHTALAVLLLLLTAIIPTAAAAGDVVGEVTVESVQAIGQSHADATLVVLLQEKTQPQHVAGNPAFTLQAEHVRVETDHTSASLSIQAVDYRHGAQTTTEDYTAALVTGIAHRDYYQFSVWPVSRDSVRVAAQHGACADMASSQEQTVERVSLVVSRDAEIASTGDTVSWQGCTQEASRVTVQGDFLLRLWEWDAELTTNGETVPLPSGKRNLDGSDPGNGDLSAFIGQATEQYLYVTNGILTIPRLTGSYQLYVQDAQATATEGFQLRGATGTVLGVAVQKQAVTVQGSDLHLALRGNGLDAPLSGLVAGGVERFTVDGVVVAGVDPWGDWSLSGWVWVGALVLAGAVGALLFPQVYYRVLAQGRATRLRGLPGASWRHRQASALMVMAGNSLERQHPRRARLLASCAVWFHEHPQAHVVRARVAHQRNQGAQAHRIHERLDALLAQDARERCRNAWHAYHALRSLQPHLATLWHGRARRYHALEYLRLAGAWPDEGDAHPRGAALRPVDAVVT